MLHLSGRTVLEIGPGWIEHTRYWRGTPARYLLVDVRESFLAASAEVLKNVGVPEVECVLTDGKVLPCADQPVDVVLTFHQLEHVPDLAPFLSEMARVLRPGGLVLGAVPCEAGLAWGLGRVLTSRRYVRKTMAFDYDKIICWEHPQFVDTMKALLEGTFQTCRSIRRPLGWLPLDFNLSWSFVFRKS